MKQIMDGCWYFFTIILLLIVLPIFFISCFLDEPDGDVESGSENSRGNARKKNRLVPLFR